MPEQHQVEHRPAVGLLEPGRRAAPRPASRRTMRHPRPLPIASPVGNGWTFSTGSGTPARPPAVPSSAMPMSSRMSSNGLTLDAGWSRGTKRSSPHQTWTSVPRHRRRRAAARPAGGRSRPASTRRSSPSRRGPAGRRHRPGSVAIRSATSAGAGLRIGDDRQLRTAHGAPHSDPTMAAAERSAPTATGSRPPDLDRLVEELDLGSPRVPGSGAPSPRPRPARRGRGRSRPRRSRRRAAPTRAARRAARRAGSCPAASTTGTGRTTTATSARPSDSVAATPRCITGRPAPPRRACAPPGGA